MTVDLTMKLAGTRDLQMVLDILREGFWRFYPRRPDGPRPSGQVAADTIMALACVGRSIVG